MRALIQNFPEAKQLVEPDGFFQLSGVQFDVSEFHSGGVCWEVA